MVNVKTRTGRLVHRAAATWEQSAFVPLRGNAALVGPEGPSRLSAAVLCRRVPAWHAFEVVPGLVTCPGCLAWMGLRGL